MELLKTEFLGKPLRLEGAMSGWQQLYWNGQLVSQRAASPESEGEMEHRFELRSETDVLQCRLQLNLRWQPFLMTYQLEVNGEKISEGASTADELQRQTPSVVIPVKKGVGIVGLSSLVLKLFKSVKVIKVVLAGLTLAAYSWLFSLPFALTLIACLVFHEYGHLRAMQYFGMKTKGMFLIPFVGGLALGDDKINTRWQDVVIAIMGPCFGLVLSLFFTVLYAITGQIFFAGIASFNALLNLFNLLPILPLDGGHILKSISFSMHSKVGVALCVGGAGLGVILCYTFGLTLLGFMLSIGCLEIFFEWRTRHDSRLLPLDRYGQIFSSVWYVLVVSGFIAVLMYLSGTGDEVLGLPLKVLQG